MAHPSFFPPAPAPPPHGLALKNKNAFILGRWAADGLLMLALVLRCQCKTF
jgi:hypothetical protein